MLDLTIKLIKGIEEGDEESILGAEEVAIFLVFGAENSGIVEPYLSELEKNPATMEDGEALQTALVSYLKKFGDNASPSALWALGKFQNTENVEILKEQLSSQLKRFLLYNKGVYNALDALHRSGEEVFKRGSSGVQTIVENIQDARDYLAKFGEVHPW